ncbi:MAG: transporter [Candidatus Eisenbacteria bacterium]
MKLVRLLAALLIVFLVAAPSSASTILGTSANTLPQGEFMVDFWFMYRDFGRSYDGNLYGDGSGGWIDLPSDTKITATSFVPRVYYGVTDWITMRAGVAFEDRYLDLAENGGESVNTGLGDLVLDPKIQIYRGEGSQPRVALLAGVRLPTGDADGSPALSDGSTDFCLGGCVTQPIGELSGHAMIIYWLNGENRDGVDVKDLWIASASLEDPVSENWTLHWEFTAYFGEQPSDYYRMYACPGLSWCGDRVTVGVSNLISVASEGGGGISWVDFDWAPYVRFYYRFF